MSIPDSDAYEGQYVEVGDTDECDNPKFGAVTITIRTSSNMSSAHRISRKTAIALRNQLTEHLEENDE